MNGMILDFQLIMETAWVYFCFAWHSYLTSFFFPRDNFLVLDIFFEALNYETIEQKKAYDVAGLLGKIYLSSVFWLFKIKLLAVEKFL